MSELISTMTDEIAFQLGKFDFKAFYSLAMWKVNKEEFPLYYFFNWSPQWGFPLKHVNDKLVPDWENISLHGSLKKDSFKEISHKLAYIRGRLSSYSVVITPTTIDVGWANSYDFREIFIECVEAVVKDKFGFSQYFISHVSEQRGTIPGTPHFKFTSSEEVIKYLTGSE